MLITALKIIGILILVIIAVVLLVLCLVLFVPIRYNFKGMYVEKPDAEARVTWPVVLLKADAWYKEGEFVYIVKLLGGVVMTNTDAKISWIGRRYFNFDEDEEIESFDNDVDTDFSVDNLDDGQAFDDSITFLEKQESLPVEVPAKGTEGTKPKKSNKQHKKKKVSPSEKIAKKIYEIKQKIHIAIEQLKRLNDKREKLLKVYHSKRFEVAKKDAIEYLKILYEILKPRVLKGYLNFGFEDPATTGKLYGILATLMPYYKNNFIVRPYFEEKKIECELNGKGKFNIFNLLRIAIKVYYNKNLMKVIDRIKKIIKN